MPGAISLVAGARLPLAFIGFGLVALTAAVGTLVRAPELLLLSHVHPHVVALAHLWLPGFLLSVSIGAIYQLMPVVLGSALRVPLAAAWTHLALHGGGLALLVGGFFLGRFELVAIGGSVVAAGTVVLLAATWRTFRSGQRRDAIAWSFPAAVTWLTLGMLLGIVLALNRRAPFLPLSVVDLLRAHAHVGLVGFFVTLLQGATFQLVPMFTMADLRRPAAVRAGVILTQVGLAVLTPGLACNRLPVALAGVGLIAVGIASSGVALGATFRSRRRRALEPGLKAFATGACLLAVATVAGLGLAVMRPGDWTSGAGAIAYGTLFVAGALSFMVLGMLCKIVPFLVWMKTYGPRAGRQPVPLTTALGSRVLEHAWLRLHAAALVALIAGVLAGSRPLLAGGAVLLALGVGMFLANVIKVLVHLVRPQTAVAARPLPGRPAGSVSASASKTVANGL